VGESEWVSACVRVRESEVLAVLRFRRSLNERKLQTCKNHSRSTCRGWPLRPTNMKAPTDSLTHLLKQC